MAELVSKSFETPLGEVTCYLNSSSSEITLEETRTYEHGNSEIYRANGHKIELVEFKIRQPLYNGETLTDSNGWIWRIQKTNTQREELEIACVLSPKNGVEFDIATGEHLDAIEAQNDKWTLHIGTEDGEVLNRRSQEEDWFPKRLLNEVDFYQSITKIKTQGVVSTIPELEPDEKLHLQYLTAYSERSPESVSSWLAVDEFKIKLEKWVGLW
jgi:hypothetical protein